MPRKDFNVWRELPAAELSKKIRDTREELLLLRIRKQTGQLEKPHRIKELRRDVARMETLRTAKMKEAALTATN